MTSRKVEKIMSKNGLPILQIEHDGNMLPIHSKYDPVKEAERILDSYKDEIEKYDHILFYGVGLGYHVKLFFERYPYKLASTYEPILEVFTECTKAVKEIKLPVEYLTYSFVEETLEKMEQNLAVLSQNLQQKILYIILPVYEKIASNELKQFTNRFKEIMQEKKANTYAEMFFSKRWTLNALMNLKTTFETPNILLEEHNPFEGKPVILAAAGPSLSEEMNNLRYIKEKGLAYIFAVGSANKALMAQNIYPDAVLTYDPQAHNHTVFKDIIENNIDTIPMIFGTTVGFETVQMYQGPKFHFLTSQDTITPYFHNHLFPTINDSSSIAIVTMQLLQQLKAGKVILVGQNFAFKNDLFYSKEIQRFDKDKQEFAGANVQTKDLIDSHMVDDTLGRQVMTNSSFDRMRLEMERYIEIFSSLQVINTTTGGAAIKGTKYKPLSVLIKTDLIKRVVDQNWYKHTKMKTNEFTVQQLIKLRRETLAFIEQYEAIMTHFKMIHQSIGKLNTSQIQKRLEKFDELFKKFTSNVMYRIVIRPITRVFFEKLQAETRVIRVLEPNKEKTESVIALYSTYLQICRDVYEEIAPIVLSNVIPRGIKNTDWKEYVSTSGIFHYENAWTIKPFTRQDTKVSIPEIYTIGVETKKARAIVRFKFTGSKLRLFGTNHSKGLLKINLIIDGKEKVINVKQSVDQEQFGSFQHQQLFEITALPKKMHEVVIEIITDEPHFIFQGIEIDRNERAYHINEVTNIDDLEIGKRIRCHYKATYNTLGNFIGLGEETAQHLPVEVTPYPDGDFYFIMIDDNIRQKKLIADRNVQNYISWKTLNKQGLSSLEGIDIKNNQQYSLCIRLPDGEHRGNEWDNFCASSIMKEEFNVLFEKTYVGSLTLNTSHCLISKKAEMVMLRGSYFNIDIRDFQGKDLNYSIYTSKEHVTFNIGFRPILQIKEGGIS